MDKYKESSEYTPSTKYEEYKIGRGKNLCGKTVKVDNPYEIYKGNGFEWRVLKKYKCHIWKKPICMLDGIVPLRVR